MAHTSTKRRIQQLAALIDVVNDGLDSGDGRLGVATRPASICKVVTGARTGGAVLRKLPAVEKETRRPIAQVLHMQQELPLRLGDIVRAAQHAADLGKGSTVIINVSSHSWSLLTSR